jgi:hypothetical protein
VPRRPIRALLTIVLVAFSLVALGCEPSSTGAQSARSALSTKPPPAKHVFVINIENKGFATTWGSGSAAPYLANTLRRKGVLLTNYYATAHHSEPNYIAQISGQGPDPQMQADCQIYSKFVQTGTVAPQQAVGSGCVFPRGVATLPGQLTSAGLTWKGYMEDMKQPCLHPQINKQDTMQHAKVGDQYATRHNPFVYFTAITASSSCRSHVVNLSLLPKDLKSISSTPNLSYITPNLCNDGHDAPCVDGRPGGLKSVNAWMKVWVPKILKSPAFQKNGVLIITADESDSPQSDSSACCGETTGPNAALPGITGKGGGRIGALVISRWTKPGTRSTKPYNHYSLLASIEDIFGRPHIGYARTVGLNRFGPDVFNRT